eukprot:TRINITY_DN3359_c0_g3_i1.p1 TRINITY_DN3359_c0_g3~~TRINITY_DN3359_c0_g3_i1.p1  ORF type:complete len:235 (+),score=6.30 TRINITY_DN3359_c0_g3_i1:136-840(+)
MCEESLHDIAPSCTRQLGRFGARWGSLFDYMDMSVSKSLSAACRVPRAFGKVASTSVDQGRAADSSGRTELVKIRSKYGRVHRAIGTLPKIKNPYTSLKGQAAIFSNSILKNGKCVNAFQKMNRKDIQPVIDAKKGMCRCVLSKKHYDYAGNLAEFLFRGKGAKKLASKDIAEELAHMGADGYIHFLIDVPFYYNLVVVTCIKGGSEKIKGRYKESHDCKGAGRLHPIEQSAER